MVELDKSNEMEIKEFKSEVVNFSGIVFNNAQENFKTTHYRQEVL